MATEDPVKSPVESPQDEMQQDAPTTTLGGTRKRPRIDLSVETTRERKRGKTMFGLLVGTLNKAKSEDKERGASEAARKRQLIEQRLQDKLKKETDSVRRAEEAKKDKTSANRKEEDLQIKDSIHKLRRTRLPLLAHFLSTADSIPATEDEMSDSPSSNPLASLPKSQPPPLFYLPAILTPSQEAFLKRRTAEVKEAAEKEWLAFQEERSAGIEEIRTLRARVAEDERLRPKPAPEREDADDEEAKHRAPAPPKEAPSEDIKMSEEREPEQHPSPAAAPPREEGPPGLVPPENPPEDSEASKDSSAERKDNGADMDVDDGATARGEAPGKVSPPKASAPPQADEDDAVEY